MEMGAAFQVLTVGGAAVDYDGVGVAIHQQVDADACRRVSGRLLDTVPVVGLPFRAGVCEGSRRTYPGRSPGSVEWPRRACYAKGRRWP